MISRIREPTVAIKIPPRSNESTFPRPTNFPRNPPRSAPTITLSIVTKNPPGSLPDMMNFAKAPATRPRRIQDRIPMATRQPIDHERLWSSVKVNLITAQAEAMARAMRLEGYGEGKERGVDNRL